MAGKARVHELAKELGVRSKDVLSVLGQQGKFVKSASSTLEAPVVRAVREHFRTAVCPVPVPVPAPDVFGPTVANLVAELGVHEAAVLGYLRHLGANVQNGSSTVAPEFAQQAKVRFESEASSTTSQVPSKARPARTKPALAADAKAPPYGLLPDPAYFYVEEQSPDVVHHLDYLSKRPDHALCGCGGMKSQPSVATEGKEICERCIAKLPEYHAIWWREHCRHAAAEVAKLKAECRRLQAHSEEQRKHIEKLLQRSKQLNQSPPKKQPQPKKQPAANGAKPRRTRTAASSAGNPFKVNRDSSRLTAKREPRVPDPEVVRKRIQEMNAPRRPKTEAEKRSDEAARESMRSYKPSSWRIGRGPSSYG